MSPLGDSGLFSVVDERPKLDADSFQKLLAAAWAIQCQHDAERQVELPEQSSRIAIPDGFFDPVINTADFDFLREPVGEDSAVKPTVAGVKIPPKSVHAATETAGALALATDRRVQAAPSKQQLPIALKVVNINHQHTATVYTIRKRDFRLALTAGAAVLLIAVIAAVWGFRVARGRKDFAQPAPSAVSASQQNSSDQRNPLVETSHLRATDSNVVAALEELSSYEIKSLRRQAMFGDDNAALLLGMSYETGKGVRRDCAEAAHWIRVSAENGNAAAQYNLGLRYLDGDGVSMDKAASVRWLRSAAKRGYQKAQNTLRELKH